MTNRFITGSPPRDVGYLLRLEGLAVFAAALYAFWYLGGSWWIFALLILAPDLSMLGYFRSQVFGAKLYNAAHTYSVPAVLALAAWLFGTTWLLPLAVIWVAHIGLDRALGFGLKYAGRPRQTHLGLIGKPAVEA